MKKTGRVVQVLGQGVSVAVNGNADPTLAACCTVPSMIVEAKNPTGTEYRPGDLVEVSDGLGSMALGAGAFLVLPAVFYGLGTALWDQWWAGAAGIGLGILLAVPAFRSLRLDRFPQVVRRVGVPMEETGESFRPL